MRTRLLLAAAVLATLAVISAACGGSGGGGSATPTPTPTSTPCVRAPAPADRPRFGVVAKPYDASGNKASAWEVLSLSTMGTLARTGATFTMGRATYGRVVFTPDGEIGLVAQEDGSVGVLRLSPNGTVTVVSPGVTGAFYANSVTITADGAHAIVSDSDTAANGGGFYGLDIGCDGTVSTNGLFVPGETPTFAALLDGGRALAVGRNVLSSPAGSDAALLDWDGVATPSLLSGIDVFGHDDAIVSDAAITSAGRFALILDDNQFSGTGDRVGIVSIGASALTAATPLAPASFSDPASIVASPFDQTALVALAQQNAIRKLVLGSNGTWSAQTITYTGGAPQLPAVLVSVNRGTLAGRVFSAENVSIRTLEFSPGHGVVDDGSLSFGSGLDAITGALGLQP